MDDRKTAVGYARQSLGRPDKSAGSVRAQLTACRAEAIARGYRYEGAYVDEAVSAYRTDSVRPEFGRMLADVRNGRVDVVVVNYLSRLTRQDAEAARSLVAGLHGLGVTVVSVAEGTYGPGTTEELVRHLEAAHQESLNRARHVSDTKRVLREAGSWVGGVPPFGYAVTEARRDGLTIRQLIVVPEEAEVVRDVVRRILTHKDEEVSGGERHPGSLSGICAELNAAGVRTKTARLSDKWRAGGPTAVGGRRGPSLWEVSTLKRILRDPRLIGHVVEPVYGPQSSDGTRARRSVVGYRSLVDPQTQMPVMSHEPVLDIDDWERLQSWLDTRGPGKGGPRSGSLLGGLGVLYCVCGATMVSNGTVGATASYRCSRPKGATGGHHGGNSIKREHLEEYVSQRVLSEVACADEGQPGAVELLVEAGARFGSAADLLSKSRAYGAGGWPSAPLTEKRDFLRCFVDRVEVAKALTRGNKWEPYDAGRRTALTWAGSLSRG
ncbi:recombinase family protein [Streptomyces sp. SID12501]|uniref:Recombinase family protein n=1 Tax=Streptomyces sp. SID12501 TaxID=2706042 RepID=A0A6B3C5K2_9ACTN|nr:recombinase family protein [Streptomyces sp. SID12501]NEC91686.1 recombinase family protein [Streptomyces sp. SID12501]